jgi:hypothetical protein
MLKSNRRVGLQGYGLSLDDRGHRAIGFGRYHLASGQLQHKSAGLAEMCRGFTVAVKVDGTAETSG